jgi:hypothetical protein
MSGTSLNIKTITQNDFVLVLTKKEIVNVKVKVILSTELFIVHWQLIPPWDPPWDVVRLC